MTAPGIITAAITGSVARKEHNPASVAQARRLLPLPQ